MFILFGPPGVGKSTLGSILAQKLTLPFYDIDYLLETHMGQSRQHLWKALGESRYRALEAHIVQTLKPGIIACGGATVLNPKNLSHLQTLGQLVYLTCPTPLLIARAFATPRALFQTKQEFLDLLKRRIPYYEKIKAIRLDTSQTIEKQMEQLL